MPMVGSRDSLLSQAGKEVQAADHCFTVLYAVSREPRMLVQVLRHCFRALELSMRALDERLPASDAADEVIEELRDLLRAFDESPQVFSRRDSFVISEDEFASLHTLSPGDIAQKIAIVKQYVYEAGRRVMVIQ